MNKLYYTLYLIILCACIRADNRYEISNTMNTTNANYEREIYKFRVGTKPIDVIKSINKKGEELYYYIDHNSYASELIKQQLQEIAGKGFDIIEIFNVKHAAFLLNTDLFDYDNHNWNHRENVGRDKLYDWDELGNALNGQTYVSPQELKKAITKDNNMWTGDKYNLLLHNCHDFVQYCLLKVGVPKSMANKFITYRNQDNGPLIKKIIEFDEKWYKKNQCYFNSSNFRNSVNIANNNENSEDTIYDVEDINKVEFLDETDDKINEECYLSLKFTNKSENIKCFSFKYTLGALMLILTWWMYILH
jgi:predicted RNA-binding protein associated with RNAse of E/G family